jgi:multisubunit Na+/H+ antiporter MnhF subunit
MDPWNVIKMYVVCMYVRMYVNNFVFDTCYVYNLVSVFKSTAFCEKLPGNGDYANFISLGLNNKTIKF